MNEIAEVLETIKDIVDIATSSIPEKKKGSGRPPVPSQDTVRVMLVQAYFGMPNRIAQGSSDYSGRRLAYHQNSPTRP